MSLTLCATLGLAQAPPPTRTRRNSLPYSRMRGGVLLPVGTDEDLGLAHALPHYSGHGVAHASFSAPRFAPARRSVGADFCACIDGNRVCLGAVQEERIPGISARVRPARRIDFPGCLWRRPNQWQHDDETRNACRHLHHHGRGYVGSAPALDAGNSHGPVVNFLGPRECLDNPPQSRDVPAARVGCREMKVLLKAVRVPDLWDPVTPYGSRNRTQRLQRSRGIGPDELCREDLRIFGDSPPRNEFPGAATSCSSLGCDIPICFTCQYPCIAPSAGPPAGPRRRTSSHQSTAPDPLNLSRAVIASNGCSRTLRLGENGGPEEKR